MDTCTNWCLEAHLGGNVDHINAHHGIPELSFSARWTRPGAWIRAYVQHHWGKYIPAASVFNRPLDVRDTSFVVLRRRREKMWEKYLFRSLKKLPESAVCEDMLRNIMPQKRSFMLPQRMIVLLIRLERHIKTYITIRAGLNQTKKQYQTAS